MANVKFGTKQVSNPTPASINLWVRVLTVILTTFLAWLATANFIGPNTKDILNGVCSLLLLLANGLAPLFGVQVSGGSVKAEDVTAMEVNDAPPENGGDRPPTKPPTP